MVSEPRQSSANPHSSLSCTKRIEAPPLVMLGGRQLFKNTTFRHDVRSIAREASAAGRLRPNALTVHVDFKFPIIWLPRNPAVTVVELNRAAWAGENESGVRHTWPSHERIVFRSTPARSRCVDLGAFLGPNHFRNVAAASSKRLTSTHEPPGNFSGGKHLLGNALCNRKTHGSMLRPEGLPHSKSTVGLSERLGSNRPCLSLAATLTAGSSWPQPGLYVLLHCLHRISECVPVSLCWTQDCRSPRKDRPVPSMQACSGGRPRWLRRRVAGPQRRFP